MKVQAFIITALIALACSEIKKGSAIYDNVVKMYENLIPARQKLDKDTRLFDPRVRVIPGKGYTYFAQKGSAMKYEGVTYDNLMPFLNYVNTLIELPERYRSTFIDQASVIAFSDYNQILSTSLIFNKEGPGDKPSYSLFLAQKNSDDTFDFLVGEIKGTFKLAPDTYIYQDTKKGWFGLTSSVSYRFEDKNRILTRDIVDAVFDYFKLSITEKLVQLL